MAPAGTRRGVRPTNDDPLQVGVSMTDSWYFAYGSNMSVDRKVKRTGVIRESVRCRVPGYRFAFNKAADDGGGYANIVPDASATVWGVAYLCDETAIGGLDVCEGVSGGHYRREIVEVVTDDDEVLQALTYVAGDDFVCSERAPRDDYLDTVLKGARHHGLPEDYIEFLEALSSNPSS